MRIPMMWRMKKRRMLNKMGGLRSNMAPWMLVTRICRLILPRIRFSLNILAVASALFWALVVVTINI